MDGVSLSLYVLQTKERKSGLLRQYLHLSSSQLHSIRGGLVKRLPSHHTALTHTICNPIWLHWHFRQLKLSTNMFLCSPRVCLCLHSIIFFLKHTFRHTHTNPNAIQTQTYIAFKRLLSWINPTHYAVVFIAFGWGSCALVLIVYAYIYIITEWMNEWVKERVFCSALKSLSCTFSK